MKTKPRGVFVADPAYPVPVEVLSYIAPGDTGWRRISRGQRAVYRTSASYSDSWGTHQTTSEHSDRNRDRNRDRDRDRVDARWRDVISTGQ